MCDRAEHLRINYADVEQRGLNADPRFLALYWELQKRYGDRSFGRKVCLHEAAHAVYMERNGVPNVRFLGPAILYDAASDRFLSIGAIVNGGILRNNLNEEQLHAIAKESAAGGVAVRKYLGIDNAGDETDFRNFQRIWEQSLPPDLRQLNPEELWGKAQVALNAELDNENIKSAVMAKTDEYFEALYRI